MWYYIWPWLFMDHWLELLKISEIFQGMILLYWYINKQHYWKASAQICGKKGNIGSKVWEFNWSYNPPFIFWTSISLSRTLLWDDDIKLIVLQKFLFAIFLFNGVKGTCQPKRLIGNSRLFIKSSNTSQFIKVLAYTWRKETQLRGILSKENFPL